MDAPYGEALSCDRLAMICSNLVVRMLLETLMQSDQHLTVADYKQRRLITMSDADRACFDERMKAMRCPSFIVPTSRAAESF